MVKCVLTTFFAVFVTMCENFVIAFNSKPVTFFADLQKVCWLFEVAEGFGADFFAKTRLVIKYCLKE